MTPQLRERVRIRADNYCENCRMPQSSTVLPHEVDHIRSQKHNGATTMENLCWSCAYCNSFKGSDVATFAPGTDELVRLFNPREDAWEEHFFWEESLLRGNTTIGSATIELLRINQAERVEHRRLLMQLGLWT